MMPEELCNFKCEAAPENWHDDLLGDLQVGTSIEPAEDGATVDDPDLGPIQFGRVADIHGGRRYTGPPVVADVLFVAWVFVSTFGVAMATCGLVIGG